MIITKVCLVRHGETDWNAAGVIQGRTDIPLNHNGMQQAKECGKYLSNFKWDVIITSPLKRAKHTAEIINKTIKVPLIERLEFIERDYGKAEGMTFQDRNKKYPDRMYPNQEERSVLNNRVMQGLDELNHNFKVKRICLVAHGGVINAILSMLSNGEIGSGKTRLNNASISNIEYVDGGWKIKDYNNIFHLNELKER